MYSYIQDWHACASVCELVSERVSEGMYVLIILRGETVKLAAHAHAEYLEMHIYLECLIRAKKAQTMHTILRRTRHKIATITTF